MFRFEFYGRDYMWMRHEEKVGRQSTPTSPEGDLGGQLKAYFNTLTAEPAPDRLMQLAEALEQALEQGRLTRRPSAEN